MDKRRLELACFGRSYSQGGLNVPQLRRLAHQQGHTNAMSLTRRQLCDILKKADGARVYRPQIRLPCKDVRIFNQVYSLCWFHTASHMLFFSDILRDLIWSKVFYCQKVKNYYIPRYIRTIDMAPRFQVYFEIIRQSLEAMMEYESGLHTGATGTSFPISVGMSSLMHDPVDRMTLPKQYHVDKCDLAVQELLREAFYSWRGPNGGYDHLVIMDVVHQLNLGAAGVQVKNYSDKDFHRYISTKKACAISIAADMHVVSLIKCNGRWCLFDNEYVDAVTADRCMDFKLYERMKISDIVAQLPQRPRHYAGSTVIYVDEPQDRIVIPKAIRDEAGRTRYNNFIERVPPQHREQVKKYIEPARALIFGHN